MQSATDHADDCRPLDAAEREALTGRRRGPYNSHNPVSRVQVWQWCAAMGDRNPLYLDNAYRIAHGFDERVVAPPAMMQMWTMRDINMEYAPGSTAEAPYEVFDKLSARGFDSNVAVSYDIRFHHLLREGDRAHHYTSIASISDLKSTALGQGYFVTERAEFLDQENRLFAEALITYFQYRALEAAAEPAVADVQPRSPEVADWQPTFRDIAPEHVNAGDTLPPLSIPITHKLVVGGAIATQDFIDVHHNLPAARAAAMPDIFMNILTSCGLSARYLSDWAGPGSRLERLLFKLMAPNTPGDTMVMRGQVMGLEGNRCEIDFAGENSRGFHVTGSATLRLAQPQH
jgi:acyl dehydratase